ncbi:hypothetical protein ACFYYR_10400 [Streptomyces sp. NPDC001922]|uniref:hypothetical protein n=1 Tax=Streptomyces sp. NPDC001922 TaxID=3364624 RepID=UPI0036BD8150
MDRFQLCEALRAAGVPAAHYEIPGCPGDRRPTESYFLRAEGSAWLVGVHERGERRVLERFTDEDAACRWLYDRLTYEGPPPTGLTPEERDELLHDSDGIQRRARRELDRALAAERERRRAGKGGATDGTGAAGTGPADADAAAPGTPGPRPERPRSGEQPPDGRHSGGQQPPADGR